MLDLNELIDPGDPLQPYIELTIAYDINNDGAIVAVGRNSLTGRSNGFLLTPVGSEPAAPPASGSGSIDWLLGLAFAALGLQRTRVLTHVNAAQPRHRLRGTATVRRVSERDYFVS
jgi:hypothetical protein